MLDIASCSDNFIHPLFKEKLRISVYQLSNGRFPEGTYELMDEALLSPCPVHLLGD